MTAPLDIHPQDDADSRRQRPAMAVRFIAPPAGVTRDNNNIKDFVRALARQAAREYASGQKK